MYTDTQVSRDDCPEMLQTLIGRRTCTAALDLCTCALMHVERRLDYRGASVRRASRGPCRPAAMMRYGGAGKDAEMRTKSWLDSGVVAIVLSVLGAIPATAQTFGGSSTGAQVTVP